MIIQVLWASVGRQLPTASSSDPARASTGRCRLASTRWSTSVTNPSTNHWWRRRDACLRWPVGAGRGRGTAGLFLWCVRTQLVGAGVTYRQYIEPQHRQIVIDFARVRTPATLPSCCACLVHVAECVWAGWRLTGCSQGPLGQAPSPSPSSPRVRVHRAHAIPPGIEFNCWRGGSVNRGTCTSSGRPPPAAAPLPGRPTPPWADLVARASGPATHPLPVSRH